MEYRRIGSQYIFDKERQGLTTLTEFYRYIRELKTEIVINNRVTHFQNLLSSYKRKTTNEINTILLANLLGRSDKLCA